MTMVVWEKRRDCQSKDDIKWQSRQETIEISTESFSQCHFVIIQSQSSNHWRDSPDKDDEDLEMRWAWEKRSESKLMHSAKEASPI